MGKALFSNVVMLRGTQFIPELGKAHIRQRCDAQQYPVTPKLGKALFGNAVMLSSTQFTPELGKARFN